jgi:2-phospho-L-lactate guanylyltransferase
VSTVIIPFRSGGKSRLPDGLRIEASIAMLLDVIEVAAAHAEHVRLVTNDAAASGEAGAVGVQVVPDPGGGQGAAVLAGIAGLSGVCLVVNADVPRVRPADLVALEAPPSVGALALVAAPDGTTNALGLPSAATFLPLYGAGSAARFRARAVALGLDVCDLDLEGLREDVDTIADLERAAAHAGARTRSLAAVLGA